MAESQVNLSEIEALIHQLYSPGETQNVITIQEQLQEAQRNHGWALADALIHSDSQNARFFAALTFNVQINRVGANLSEDDQSALLRKLLSYVVQFANRREPALVLRRLCSALAAYFMLPNSSWRRCVRHLLICLSSKTFVSEEDAIGDFDDTENVVKNLGDSEFSTAQIFATVIAENVNRVDQASVTLAYCRERLALNLNDTAQLFECVLTGNAGVNALQGDRISDALRCYQAWVNFAKDQFSRSSPELRRLRDSFHFVAQSLSREDTLSVAAELLIEIFTNYEEFVGQQETKVFTETLQSPWSLQLLEDLERGNNSESSEKFAEVVLAFGQMMSSTFFVSPEDCPDFMPLMHRITRTQSHATIEQGLSNAVVDFWEHFITNATQSGVDDAVYSAGFAKGKSQWLLALPNLCAAMVLPSDNSGDLLRPPADTAFAEFRTRTRDTVQMSYNEFDLAVMEALVNLALNVHRDQTDFGPTSVSWGYLEAIFSCLDGLSESLHYSASDLKEEDAVLKRLFDSKMFGSLTDFSLSVPTVLRKRVLRLVGEYQEFLGRNEAYLLNALDVLCHGLLDRSLMDVCARGCFTLCDGNRLILLPKSNKLLEVAASFFNFEQANEVAKEYMAGAAAALIQASQNIAFRKQSMEQLLAIIEQDFQRNLRKATGIGEETPHEFAALITLSQLECIGKASQAPDSSVFELSDDEDAIEDTWIETQGKIAGFLELLIGPSRASGSILEAACKIVRTGFQESHQGPFKFDAQLVVGLLITTPLDNPRLDYAISTATAWVTAHASSTTQFEKGIHPLAQFVFRAIEYVGRTQYDPEIACSILNFFERFARYKIQLLIQLPNEHLDMVFSLSFVCLERPDPLPKRAAAELWTTVLNIPSSRPDNASTAAENIIVATGPRLAIALVDNFGGLASRSDLEALTHPLRKLIFRQPQAKSWIQAALTRPQFPSSKVSASEKQRFVAQIVRLRGDKKTNAVAREFWLVCRGTPTGYN